MKLRLLFFFLSIAVLGCSSPKPLVYRGIQGVRVQSVSLQQVTLVAELEFYNPNNYRLQLKNGDVDAYFNSKLLGKALIDERTSIPARNTFLLPVSVTANLGNLLTNAVDILSKQAQEVLVNLHGTIRAGKGGVFINVPVQYEGKQRIQL